LYHLYSGYVLYLGVCLYNVYTYMNNCMNFKNTKAIIFWLLFLNFKKFLTSIEFTKSFREREDISILQGKVIIIETPRAINLIYQQLVYSISFFAKNIKM